MFVLAHIAEIRYTRKKTGGISKAFRSKNHTEGQ